MLDYAIVVATRNRPDMLRASLPAMVNQSRPASRIIVVDRSDDHNAIRSVCEPIAASASMPFEVIYGEAANLPAQRNQGLARVTEDVTIFPDDDSLWFTDTAEHFMKVYEADSNGRYGAVTGTEVNRAPGLEGPTPPRASRATNRDSVMRVRNWLESGLVPQPFNVYGLEQTAALGPLASRDGLSYPLVPTIAGFRMSFRTDLAQQLLFDAVLGSRVGYATHEDKDMGLRVLAAGFLIAAAPDARVFHNAHPGTRAGGFAYGFFHILNYMYICRKIFPETSGAFATTQRYCRYKVALYGVRQMNSYMREVRQGSRAAYSEFDVMMSAKSDELPDRYREICDRNLPSE